MLNYVIISINCIMHNKNAMIYEHNRTCIWHKVTSVICSNCPTMPSCYLLTCLTDSVASLATYQTGLPRNWTKKLFFCSYSTEWLWKMVRFVLCVVYLVRCLPCLVVLPQLTQVRDGRFGSKVGQIGPKWDKSVIRFPYILACLGSLLGQILHPWRRMTQQEHDIFDIFSP